MAIRFLVSHLRHLKYEGCLIYRLKLYRLLYKGTYNNNNNNNLKVLVI